MKRRKTKRLILILLLLVLLAGAALWLMSTQRLRTSAKNQDVALKAADSLKSAPEEVVKIQDGITSHSIAEHIYSHRGSAGIEEHSFKAYDEAIAAGSKNLELDIVMSSDRVLFVSHDINASFMTDTNANYADMTAAEIEGLRTRAGGKVLRLSEVFDKYGKDVNYLIELKTNTPAINQAFKDIIAKYKFQDVVGVQSVYADSLRVIEEDLPDMEKVLVCRTQDSVDYGLPLSYVDMLAVSYDEGLMTDENLKAARDNGKRFSAWTLNDEASIKKAIDMGLDLYFTDDTALAMSIEKDYGLKKRAEAK